MEALLKNTSATTKSDDHDLDHEVENVRAPSSHVLDLTDLWSETHKNSHAEDAGGQDQAGKRYRSSIRIMVRPEVVQQLQRPVRANSSDGLSRSSSRSSETARSAKKLSAAGARGHGLSEAAAAAAAAAALFAASSQQQQQPSRSIVKEQFR